MIDSCIGIDPGPATGMCFLDFENGRLVGRTLLQAVGADAPLVLKGMLHAYYTETSLQEPRISRRVGSVEKFVTGASAGSRGTAADVTRQLVMELAEVLQMFGYRVNIRPAADVKPWATDKRLTAAAVVTGKMHGDMNHAYDAARHALYGGHGAGVVTDPLRKKTIAGASPDQVIYDELPGWLGGKHGV